MSEHNLISLSGGRSSAYMLYHLAEIHDLTDTDRWQIVFANTGREREETLVFVQQIADHTGLPINWIEYERKEGRLRSYRITDFVHAKRNGEPYSELIAYRKFLPNQSIRFCTGELKIRPIKSYLKTTMGWKNWNNYIGLRADEIHRLLDARANSERESWTVQAPMINNGVDKDEVNRFWASMPYDLELKSYQGNCDLCFLKGKHKKIQLLRENPLVADWWIEQELKFEDTFDKRFSVLDLLKMSKQPTLFDLAGLDDSEGINCFCTN